MTRNRDDERVGNADDGRSRQAKGSVLEAIGKIIGDPAVETRGQRETEAGVRQAKRERPSLDRAAERKAGGPPIPPINPPIDSDGKD
ncbi:hypothetical protein [Sphingomonas faeni]|uniref:hypothetical protein n=1 Tax=Sphingomonas faeni TaxID=185950 RepID=UPI0033451AFB